MLDIYSYFFRKFCFVDSVGEKVQLKDEEDD